MVELTYLQRKKERTDHQKFVEGWKQIPCSACSGSGKYDHGGSPNCSGCGGSGKAKVSPERYLEYQKYQKKVTKG